MASALNKQTTEGAKRELQFLLSTPLIASEFSGRYPTMTGSLPQKLYRPSDLGAVDALNQNLSSTTSILGKKNKPVNSDRKFKGFKKKKGQKKNTE